MAFQNSEYGDDSIKKAQSVSNSKQNIQNVFKTWDYLWNLGFDILIL